MKLTKQNFKREMIPTLVLNFPNWNATVQASKNTGNHNIGVPTVAGTQFPWFSENIRIFFETHENLLDFPQP